MKLWQKNNEDSQTGDKSQQVNRFTVGKDRDFDLMLAPFDVLGSMAHARMLSTVGLLTQAEANDLQLALKVIFSEIEAGKFIIQDDVEDVHSQIEILLTARLGDTGKKIHSARSRNDQVLLDVKLFLRNEIEELTNQVFSFFKLLQEKSEQFKDDLLPGYTHLQLAMPSSFGLWFGAYAESLVDDCISLHAAYEVVNKNPLGSAAGYGSSFPINRSLTTELLGFDHMNYNVVYAQMGRGKAERITAQALANIADTLAKMSMDICLFLNPGFGFIHFPEDLTTGSSIMPHKKNPDVFELIRAYCNRIKALPNEISMMTTNLPSGYHRDLQLLKEHLFPAFATMKDCINMASLMLSHIEVEKKIMNDKKYLYAFSVEAVNELVLAGMPFRDAYKKVAEDIAAGNFTWDKSLAHTHEGSIGDLQHAAILNMMQEIMQRFNFNKVHQATNSLLQFGQPK